MRFTAGVFVGLVAGTLARGAWAQPIVAQSTFDATAEGWTIRTNNNSCQLTALNTSNSSWVAAGGNPGGYVQHVDPAESRTAFWRSPAAFHGDLSAAYGGTLEFDLRQSATTSQYNEFDVVLSGNGLTLLFDTPYNPRTTWTHYQVPLRAGTGWRVGTCTGPFATASQLQQALAGVTMWLIRTEFRVGGDTDGMDNVMLVGPPPSPLPTSSDFENGSDGWWVLSDATLSWDATGGVPGGCLRGDDLAAGAGYAFVAPSKYLGDRSSMIGQSLRFDFRASPAFDFVPNVPFVNLSNLQTTISYVSPGPVAGNVWRRQRIPLAPCPGWIRADNSPATLQDFQDVLGSLSFFSIRGEFRDGDEVEFMDNVILGTCEPSAYVPPSTCREDPISITVFTGGEAPASYVWRLDGVPIDAGANPSAATATLVIANGPGLDSGPYDCIVTNSCGSTTSNSTALIPCCDPDYDQDGNADQSDVLYLINALAGGDNPTGRNLDFNHDGNLDQDDTAALVDLLAGGPCP